MSIKSWWRSLFQEPDLSTSGLPKVTCDVPMPGLKEAKSEEDISEPVISFVQLYKKNHRRFKITVTHDAVLEVDTWSIYDKVENKIFSCRVFFGYYNSCYRGDKNTAWATEAELIYIFEEIRFYLMMRESRIKSKKNSRDRARLTKLYKGE